ncbi:MAG: hypothetical protein OQK56_00060 [Ignavibacteriaceae bacterium]|jgi:predicted RNA-binding Zn-ribbon protein involved in translation (DUF1610 family)|nr:hypothetical protein [Ignavibacteriaceae bacterium]MCW9066527.1 hypothetical protein [Ignavibacteriaceae bacterium]
MTKKKYQCEDCGYYWELNPAEQFPLNCPVCLSSRIHRSSRHKRFAKKLVLMLEELTQLEHADSLVKK